MNPIEIPMTPVPASTRAAFAMVSGGLPLAILFMTWKTAGPTADTQQAIIASIALLIAAMSVGLDFVIRRRQCQISDRLEIKAGFYKIEIAPGDITDVHLVQSDEELKALSSWRTNGIGLGRYRAGWFRSRERRPTFFAACSSDAVVIRTAAGPSVVLDPADIQAFHAALRSTPFKPPPAAAPAAGATTASPAATR
jgi:hypothetical protein